MQCRICGSIHEHRTYTAKEMMLGLRDSHRYFECRQCGCLQIAEIPADLARYYPENYYSYHSKARGNLLKQALLKSRDRYAATGKPLLGKLLQLAQPNDKLATLRPTGVTADSRILDVGCGAGLLLHSLRDIGFKHLLGLDPFNRTDIAYPNGLRIEKRDLATERGEWDLIMFHHSFEHLPDQQAVLQQAFQQLKPGGMALVRIPTVSSYVWQHYGVNWVQLDAPRHLYLHSVKSIQHLADATGFTVEQVVYDSSALQFWGSEQYERDIPLRDPRSYAENPGSAPFSKAQIRDFGQRARELNAVNQGDQAAFYLRKPA